MNKQEALQIPLKRLGPFFSIASAMRIRIRRRKTAGVRFARSSGQAVHMLMCAPNTRSSARPPCSIF
jgi:hypothetical protein